MNDFEFNLPLQAYRLRDGISVINYMPRKANCEEIDLEEFNEDGLKEKDVFYKAAFYLLNLALLFIEFADGEREAVYYHDEDVEKHFGKKDYKKIVFLLKKTFLKKK